MTRWVAELGSNHNSSLDMALALVEAAAAAGFQDVKTQAWRLEELFSPEALEARPELREREALEVPSEWHPKMRQRAHELGMRYGVTPCSLHALGCVVGEADWLKVGSYSLLDHDLLEACAWSGKPLVVSTGMATEKEVSKALWSLRHAAEKTLLHCVSAYPAPPHESNLRSIPYMRERFGVPVGWSDHTVSIPVVRRAEKVFGASVIELHFDLDDQLGAEAAHSWTPEKIRKLRASDVCTDEGYYACDGKHDRKAPTLSEEAERGWRADPVDGLRPFMALRAGLLSATHGPS